jgi:hypothetical protein
MLKKHWINPCYYHSIHPCFQNDPPKSFHCQMSSEQEWILQYHKTRNDTKLNESVSSSFLEMETVLLVRTKDKRPTTLAPVWSEKQHVFKKLLILLIKRNRRPRREKNEGEFSWWVYDDGDELTRCQVRSVLNETASTYVINNGF